MLENLEIDVEMDPEFMIRDACRKAGQPVEIARTDRLLVRETIVEDVPKLYRIWKEPEVGRYVQPMQPTLEKEIEFMRAYIQFTYAFYDFGLWTVLEQKTGEIVGRAGLFPSGILDDAVEMGYMIAAAHQRKGYASESGRAILAYAFDTLDLDQIHLLVDCGNPASIRTAETLGFVKKGILHRGGQVLCHFICSN